MLVGSVSGGCVEKQLSESFKGQPVSRAHVHSIDDQQAKRYGLACGGELELVFETITQTSQLKQILNHLANRERICRVVDIGNAEATLRAATRRDTFSWHAGRLQQVFGPSWRLLIVGAGQLSRFTAQFARTLDFEVIVVDPRESFRLAWDVDGLQVLGSSPDEAVLTYTTDSQSAVLALSHDPNIDDLALLEALPSDAFFVGALGSTRNYQKRCERLAGLDVPASAIARLRGPVGLPIGSRTSAEIAISIMAELVQARHQFTTMPVEP